MAEVIIMIGSNAPSRSEIIGEAVSAVVRLLHGTKVSAEIDNPDFTGEGPDYLNVVVAGQSCEAADALLGKLADIEQSLGREEYQRPIVGVDIDLVVYAGKVLKPREFGSDAFRCGITALKIW